MESFDYLRAATVEGAVQTLAGGSGAKCLGGGTNILDFMKLNVEAHPQLLDINHLHFNKIESVAGAIRIGAGVRNSDLAYDSRILENFPVLSEALLAGATAQIRNMATVGGNLLQRTRCTYFRDPVWECNKRQPGSGCAALEGDNHGHAILGVSKLCIATHPSDMCVALAALDAIVEVQGPQAKRRIPIGDFHVAYGENPAVETTLKPDELILAVELPLQPLYRNSHYLKVRERNSFAFALSAAAVALEIKADRIVTARVALGGVATKPWRSSAAEQALVGQPVGEKTYAAAARAAVKGAQPQKDNGFKVDLIQRTICRALMTLEQRLAKTAAGV
ncbi:MAG TPA: xanthine dehydrogenase family protein subunit M [Pirellulales bacterium]|jgi:xanthine dehydrogenase YagS FAD-binding subunit|nr:xanthine dehydrogenase family protein subunit M [Pirellulales bacterium]